MTSLQRFASSALRCEASRESLWRVFWWRIAVLILTEIETARMQGLDDLVDRLLAEVRDRVELALGLRDQVADRLDARALEAVVRAHAELELLDEDVVHRRAAAAAGGAAGRPAPPAPRAPVGRRHAPRARAPPPPGGPVR